MNNEYAYLMQVVAWVLLWTFVPFIALPLFIVVMVKHFRTIRQQRKMQERAQALHVYDRQWSRMEGMNEQDSADWWKR
jgi:hypothetical protein